MQISINNQAVELEATLSGYFYLAAGRYSGELRPETRGGEQLFWVERRDQPRLKLRLMPSISEKIHA